MALKERHLPNHWEGIWSVASAHLHSEGADRGRGPLPGPGLPCRPCRVCLSGGLGAPDRLAGGSSLGGSALWSRDRSRDRSIGAGSVLRSGRDRWASRAELGAEIGAELEPRAIPSSEDCVLFQRKRAGAELGRRPGPPGAELGPGSAALLRRFTERTELGAGSG